MPDERLYVIAYDIGHPKRWRRVFKLMHGYGRWLQLSVFQCRVSARRRAALAARLDALIHHAEDHILILDLGPTDRVDLRIESFGMSYEAPERHAIEI